jgi:hypothetical protein
MEEQMFTKFRVLGLLLCLTLFVLPLAAQANSQTGNAPALLDKIDAHLLAEIQAEGQADFFIWMVEQADVSAAYQLQTKLEKGQYVFDTLQATAETTQRELRSYLDAQGVEYRPFYVANTIAVFDGSENLLMDIAARPDVDRIVPNRQFQLDEPMIDREAPAGTAAVEPNISFIKAPDVWAMGITGQGTVMAGGDTGMQWDHPALINHYRGWDGVNADHNYNWWDATGTYPNVPGDGHGHGTHISGTMVGDDGGTNQIGVAPGAQVIHCKNMTNTGSGSDLTFTTCFEFVLAPWDLSGQNPMPSLAPDAMNNSWGYFGGGQGQFAAIIQNLHAAGILVEVSAGNEGSSCGTLRSPGDYDFVLTTGSVGHAVGTLPGTLTGFSSRGPSSLYPGAYIPTIMAPGENIRSSIPGGGYQGGWSGTSMSGPHATALVGLMWSANPGLAGMVDETMQMIIDTAVPLTGVSGSNCGGDYTTGPNNDWGFGTIDALAAVQAAILYGGSGTLDGTVTDQDTSNPIEGATVEARLDPDTAWSAMTDVNGYYNRVVVSGTYTVTASAFGYLPDTVTDVVVTEAMTTTVDFSLEPADLYVVSGQVTDANTGWPLYASIEIENSPYTIWTDPADGSYSVALPAGTEFTFNVNAWVDGYLTGSRDVGPLTDDATEDFALDVDVVACTAPGYSPTYSFFDDFESGYAEWTMSGLWNEQSQSDTCGGMVAPFPSPVNAAYYGDEVACNFDVGTNTGSLTMVDPVTIPSEGAVLTYWSYEETECNGNCSWDKRYTEVSIDGGTTWTTIGEGHTEGVWHQRSFDLSPYADEDLQVRFRFNSVDSIANAFFGWMVDDVSVATGCEPAAGSIVVGNVYDENTGAGLPGAQVHGDSGYSATAMATPQDPDVDDGFYTLFAPEGSNVLTATHTSAYGSDSATLTVGDGETVHHDFWLPAGWLQADPNMFVVNVLTGTMTTVPMNLHNLGGMDANYQIQEREGGYSPMPPIAGQSWTYSEAAAVGLASVRSAEGRAALAGHTPDGNIVWTGAQSLPAGDGVVRYGHAQCADNPNSFYVISGVNQAFSVTDKVWRYDADDDQWTQLASIPTGQEGISALCYEDYIYVLGGGGTNQFYIYDIAANSWSAAPALPRLMWGAAVGAYDGHIYMIGGDSDFNFGGTSNLVNIYDINAGSWVGTGTVMPTAAVSAGFAQAGEYLYIVGGWGDASPGQNVNQTQRYEMGSDNWETGPTFTSARGDLALALTESHLYAIGGDANGGGAFDATNVVQKLDHTAWPGGSWEAATSLPGPLTAHKGGYCTDVVAGGEVWSVGGYTGAAVVGTTQYEPAEGCFSDDTDVPWLSTDPTEGTVAANGTEVVDITFDATVAEVDALGIYTATLRINNNTVYGPINVPVMMRVVETVYGVELDPEMATDSADPGESVVYVLTITNTGTESDTFDLMLTGNAWNSELSTDSITLAAGASTTFMVTVDIPPQLFGPGHSDMVTVTAASVNDPFGEAVATAQLTTEANEIYRLWLPFVIRP